MIQLLPKRRRRTLEELDAIRMQRSDGIRRILFVVAIILLVLVSFLASLLVLSPLLDLYTLRQEQEMTERELEQARADEEEAQSRFRWMMDPEYYEQIARDRANQAKDGEFVIRRPAPSAQTPPLPRPERPRRN